MTHPLIERLITEFAYPNLQSRDQLNVFVSGPGVHVIFTPGDIARNLETPDVAVILPELRQAFQGGFDCAVAGEEIEAELREETAIRKTPGLIFYRDGHFLGGIAKVRDWDDYMARVTHILSQKPQAAVK